MKKNRFFKIAGIILCLVMLCVIGVMTASAEDDNVITTVHIYDIDAPVPGEPPDFYGSVPTGAAYCIIQNERGVHWSTNDNSVKWDCETYSSFVKDTYYKVKVYIEPNAGYEFPANASDITAYFGSGKERAWVYKDSNGYYVQQSFDRCGTILTVAITTAVPEVGAKPEFKTVWDGRYYSYGNKSPEVEGVKWYDETESKHLISGTTDCYFKAHHTYTVSYSVYAVDGCEFGNASAVVNGKKAKLEWANSGAVTVSYTFETGCAPEFVEPQPPSCGSTGHTYYYACDCGKLYWDEEAKQPIADKEEILIPPTGAHTGGTATCSDKAVCTVCGKDYGEVNKDNHKAVTTLKAVAATYKADGLTEGKKCADCGKIIVAQKTVARKKLGKVKSLKTKAVKLASGSKSSLTLSWAKVTGAEKYEIQQYVSKKWKTIKTTSKTSYTVGKLKADKSYKFRVRAVAGKYYGSYSSTYTGKTVPLKTDLTLKAGKKQLTASWKALANITGYEVQYSTSKKFTKKTTKTVTIEKAKTKKTTIKKLIKGKKYYVKVRAYKTVSGKKVYGAWSSVKNVKVK